MVPARPPRDVPEDEAAAARAFRPKSRRAWLAAAANVLLLTVMLGGPYLRGHLRTRALWPRFAAAAACVLGGEATQDPGLGLPPGDREQFARNVLHPGADWPQRCEPLLEALVEKQVTFLLPSVKTAELDIEVTVGMLRKELASLAHHSAGLRVPVRPVLALEQVRAALARHAQEAGMLSVPQRNAIRWSKETEVRAATRVPLYASVDARVWLERERGSLGALALDRRGLSYVAVANAGLRERRAPRPRLLRGVWRRGASNWLVWAMSRERCAERKDRCTGKSLGVAPLDLPFEGLPDPRWLASHPAGRIDRSLHLGPTRATVLAATGKEGAGGGASLRVRAFALPATPAPKATESQAPLGPVELWPASVAAGGMLLPNAAGAILHGQDSDAHVAFYWQRPKQQPEALASLPGKAGWSTACADGSAVALGTDSHFAVFRPGEGRLTAAVAFPVRKPLHPTDSAMDGVRMLCHGGASTLVMRSMQDHLAVAECDRRCALRQIARHVRWLDATLHAKHIVVAYSGTGGHAQVLSRRWSAGSASRAEKPVTPGPCWEGGGGMCGLPRLTSAGDHLLLATREGTDMRVMESRDVARSWVPMEGLHRAGPK